MKIEIANRVEGVAVGKLVYGAVVLYNSSVYVKVNKGVCGDGISLNWTRNNCVLVNLKLGTLRQLEGDTRVVPLDGAVKMFPMDPLNYSGVTK